MTREEGLELLSSYDLPAIGMQADAARERLHPDGIVTYSTENGPGAPEVIFNPGGDWLSQLEKASGSGAVAIAPRAGPGLMAVDYLKLVALCRLHLGARHIEVDWRTVGLKVAQLALRFGADDFGQVAEMRNEPNSEVTDGATEEEVRRVIRDAGFVPKKRLATYGAIAAF